MRISKAYRLALKQLFEALPHGSIQAIANELGITRLSVESVRDCKWQNDEVVELAKKKLKEYNESIREKEAKLIDFVDVEVRQKQAM